MALIASRLASGSGLPRSACELRNATSRYSNTLGWNTFPVPTLTEQEQGRPDPLRRGHPAGARGAFPGDDRRPLRSRSDARRPARGARAQRRDAGAHLHRPSLQERHRAAGKAVRTLHEDDRAASTRARPRKHASKSESCMTHERSIFTSIFWDLRRRSERQCAALRRASLDEG